MTSDVTSATAGASTADHGISPRALDGASLGLDQLQRNLVTYHLNGVGPSAASDVVRATMLIRANCLVRGPSAIRPEVIDLLIGMLDAGIEPIVPERGSLGASGDLVPLGYVANSSQTSSPAGSCARPRTSRCPLTALGTHSGVR